MSTDPTPTPTLGTCERSSTPHTFDGMRNHDCWCWNPLPAPKPEGRTDDGLGPGLFRAAEIVEDRARFWQGSYHDSLRGLALELRWMASTRSPEPAAEETIRCRDCRWLVARVCDAAGNEVERPDEPFPRSTCDSYEPSPAPAPEETARAKALEAAASALDRIMDELDDVNGWLPTALQPQGVAYETAREAIRALSDEGGCQEPGCLLSRHEPGSSHWDGKRGWTSPAPSPSSAEPSAESDNRSGSVSTERTGTVQEVPEEVGRLPHATADLLSKMLAAHRDFVLLCDLPSGCSPSEYDAAQKKRDAAVAALLRALRGTK